MSFLEGQTAVDSHPIRVAIYSPRPPQKSGLADNSGAFAPVAASSRAERDPIEEVLGQDLPFPRARETLMEEFERRYVERVLAKYNGNVGRAAAASGIARRYFQMIRSRAAK